MHAEEQALTRGLRTHVEQLAGEIGERNIFRPQALQAAASYIERQWEQQGYTSRAKKVVEDFLGDFRPEFWVSDRYSGQTLHPKSLSSAMLSKPA